MKLHSNAQILEAARLVIYNTQKDPDIQKRMSTYGFPPKRLQDGKALLEKAILLQDIKTIHYDERWAISQQVEADMEIMKATFKDHVLVARTAFRHDAVVLHSLKIERLSTRKWESVRQALYFYTKLEEHAAVMEPFGINLELIRQTKISVASLLDMKEERARKKGVAEDTTQEKKKAFKELREWVVEFRTLARYAFKDSPQMLESFGILVPSAS